MKNSILIIALLLIAFCVQSEAKILQSQFVQTKTVNFVDPPSIKEVLNEFETRAELVEYRSESSTLSPVHSFIATRTVWSMSKANFLWATGKPSLSYVEEVPSNTFFAPQVALDADWYDVQDYLESITTDYTVFKVYTGITTYDVYAVGLYPVPNSTAFYIVGIQSYGTST